MSVKVFDSKEAQDLLKAAANLGSQDGNARAKQIVHRLLGDLFKAIDDLDMTPDEIWAGVHYFNKLGQDGEAALLAAIDQTAEARVRVGGNHAQEAVEITVIEDVAVAHQRHIIVQNPDGAGYIGVLSLNLNRVV